MAHKQVISHTFQKPTLNSSKNTQTPAIPTGMQELIFISRFYGMGYNCDEYILVLQIPELPARMTALQLIANQEHYMTTFIMGCPLESSLCSGLISSIKNNLEFFAGGK